MRGKILLSLCLVLAVALAAGDYLFNRSGAQDAPKKAEPEKKSDLFDVLKQTLETKKAPKVALPTPPVPTPKVEVAPTPLPPVDAPKPVASPLSVPLPTQPPVGLTPEPGQPLPLPAPAAPKGSVPPGLPSPPIPTPNIGQPSPIPVPVPAEKPAPLNPNPQVESGWKPATGNSDPLTGVRTTSGSPSTPAVVKTKSSPWSLKVEVVNDQTVVTATLNKKHEFMIVCQTLDLQTGKDALLASGKVAFTGDALNARCNRLTISLVEDRIILEGSAEVQIQKTQVSHEGSATSAFELKGDTLNLRISELQSSKFQQTSFSREAPVPAVEKAGVLTPDLPTGGKQWSSYGKLVKAQAKDGGPSRYWLENRSGLVMLYLSADNDATLSQYVGQTISVYGPMTNGNRVRVTHIAVP